MLAVAVLRTVRHVLRIGRDVRSILVGLLHRRRRSSNHGVTLKCFEREPEREPELGPSNEPGPQPDSWFADKVEDVPPMSVGEVVANGKTGL